jgi:tripartite-type tricarboxylate transporter receptor subunit TctC
MNRVSLLLLALCLGVSACGDARAQYPSKPIRILVPNPPGGATDTLGRIFAPKLSEYLGQPVVVENRPGSNGNMSSELAARAPADGYTLLIAPDSQIVINPHLYARMAVDPIKDLQPVASLVSTQLLLAANAAVPAKGFAEFIELARQSNPSLAYASIGSGSSHHLAMEMLKARANLNLLHVPYKGGGPATMAILAGEVPVMFGGNSVSGHVRSGKLRALALAGKRRSPAYPDVPTLGEFYPGLEITTWIGVFAPQAMPAPVLAKLRAGFQKLMADPDILERIRQVGGLDPFVTTPEEFAEMVRADHAMYGPVVKSAGVKVD